MNLTDMIQMERSFDRDVIQDKKIRWSPEERLFNAYVSLDVELSELANTVEWFKVWKENRGQKMEKGKTHEETVLSEYVDAMSFFFNIANQNKWTYLLLISDEEMDGFAKKPMTMSLNKVFLSLKLMISKSLFSHKLEDFKHAWHLFIKFGLVDLNLSWKDIENEFFKKNMENIERQENNY